MIKRDRSILKLLSAINRVFAKDVFTISGRWDSLCDIGLQKGNKLIYISTFGCKKNHYFYECEEILENSDIPYKALGSDDNVTEEQLLEVISKFFGIPQTNSSSLESK